MSLFVFPTPVKLSLLARSNEFQERPRREFFPDEATDPVASADADILLEVKARDQQDQCTEIY